MPVNASALFEVAGVKALGGLEAELAKLTSLTGGTSPLDHELAALKTL